MPHSPDLVVAARVPRHKEQRYGLEHVYGPGLETVVAEPVKSVPAVGLAQRYILKPGQARVLRGRGRSASLQGAPPRVGERQRASVASPRQQFRGIATGSTGSFTGSTGSTGSSTGFTGALQQGGPGDEEREAQRDARRSRSHRPRKIMIITSYV
jgi:hypothetical protein